MTARLTRQGWMVLVSAVIAVAIGRLFGVLELFVIGAALAVAALLAVVTVWLRRPRVEVHRWIRPSVLTAGDVGRVEVLVQRVGAGPSPGFELVEPVGANRTARMAVAPLGADAEVSAGYRIPTERRGVLTVGPLTAVRHDVLGLARSVTTVAGVDEVLVSPRAHLLDMPTLGPGRARAPPDGAGPAARARRLPQPARLRRRRRAAHDPLAGLGPLREAQGPPAHRRGPAPLPRRARPARRRRARPADEAFERAVTVAASVVHSADQAGLTTRFVTTDGADIRGPDVAAQTLHLLARIAPSPAPAVPVERDPGEGLGLVVAIGAVAVVGAAGRAGARRRPDADGDRRVHAGHPGPPGPAQRRRPDRGVVPRNWTRLAGVGGGDATRPQRRDRRRLVARPAAPS